MRFSPQRPGAARPRRFHADAVANISPRQAFWNTPRGWRVRGDRVERSTAGAWTPNSRPGSKRPSMSGRASPRAPSDDVSFIPSKG